MTGYSSSRVDGGRVALAVTLKSTNHRFLDLQIRLAPGVEFLEPLARRLVKEGVVRGHVELAISWERLEAVVALRLDRALLKSYVDACREIREHYTFSGEPDVVALLRIPGVVLGFEVLPDDELENVRGLAERVLGEAIGRLNEMRAREGETLAAELRSRLEKLERLGGEVEALSSEVLPALRERIERRLREFSLTPPLDPARLAQEAATLALRADIAEEVTRLRSHVAQAKGLIEAGGEVGKKLDFLLQEMNREANTVLSKTTDVPGPGARVSECAVEMKVEVEKIREQAQNIE